MRHIQGCPSYQRRKQKAKVPRKQASGKIPRVRRVETGPHGEPGFRARLRSWNHSSSTVLPTRPAEETKHARGVIGTGMMRSPVEPREGAFAPLCPRARPPPIRPGRRTWTEREGLREFGGDDDDDDDAVSHGASAPWVRARSSGPKWRLHN